jgi:hypothetical protein
MTERDFARHVREGVNCLLCTANGEKPVLSARHRATNGSELFHGCGSTPFGCGPAALRSFAPLRALRYQGTTQSSPRRGGPQRGSRRAPYSAQCRASQSAHIRARSFRPRTLVLDRDGALVTISNGQWCPLVYRGLAPCARYGRVRGILGVSVRRTHRTPGSWGQEPTDNG